MTIHYSFSDIIGLLVMAAMFYILSAGFKEAKLHHMSKAFGSLTAVTVAVVLILLVV